MSLKILKIISLFFIGFNCSYAQKITETISGKIPNAQILKTDKRYIVFGVKKNVFYIDNYDQYFRDKQHSEIVLNEKVGNSVLFEKNETELIFQVAKYMPGRNMHKISYSLIDATLKIEHYDKEWSSLEKMRELALSEKTWVLPETAYTQNKLKKKTIAMGPNYITLIQNEDFKYKSSACPLRAEKCPKGTYIRSLHKINDTTFTQNWKTHLIENNRLMDYEWYKLNEVEALLRIVHIDKNSVFRNTIYKIDLVTGDILFDYVVNLENEDAIVSTVAEHPNGYLYILGNILSTQHINTKGFMIRLNSKGREVKRAFFDLKAINQLANDSITEYTPYLQYTCTFKAGSDNVYVAAELYEYFDLILTDGTIEDKYQFLGLYSFELTPDLIQKNKNFNELMACNAESYPLDLNILSTNIIVDLESYQNHDYSCIYDGVPLKKIIANGFRGDNNYIITEIENNGKTTYRYAIVLGPNTGKSISLGEELTSQPLFFNLKDEFVRFNSNRKGYELNRIQLPNLN